jgi:signal transduction histidine kinase
MARDDSPGVSIVDLSAGGETGRLIRDKDWAATALGPRDSWPRSLHNYLSMIFELPTAAIIFWGPTQIQLYNDGYSVIMGPRHPQYLGETFRECWPEAYETIHPWMSRVLENGETVAVNRTLVPLTRYGFTEEAYFTFSFSPLRDDQGRIAGILQIVTEVTDAVLWERRISVLHELSNQTAHANTTDDALRRAAEVLSGSKADLPFSIIYLADRLDKRRFVLSTSTGLSSADHRFPTEVELSADAVAPIPELAQVICERRGATIDNLAARMGTFHDATLSEPPTRAVAEPIATADQQRLAAILIAGISPRLQLDQSYRGFLELVAAQLATLLVAARAHEDERRHAEALAEIDRAKTEFFSNVSHEFRTPLTLILGPLEDALSDPSKALREDALAAVHRNALRLLRLVNNLLDFARIESNRLTSSLEPTDVAALTAGLAGSFQSLVESAGLKLYVDCPPISELVYVDRSQWEKIVLNLVSNAFKFTFDGEIAVRLSESEGDVQLSVSDTGVGIPGLELPKIFDRFHRVAGARGRSFEGTGIGLALVEGLAKQHGGCVRVESIVEKGTTFTVSIPKRGDRAPTDPTASVESSASGSDAASYIRDATYWSGVDAERRRTTHEPHAETRARVMKGDEPRSRILVVDDNADMREYLVRILSQNWLVETAEDGQAAFESAVRRRPDLILSDVMMPRMDGVALLNALRANPETRTVPIMLLSARAGEDAIVHGFETGADDYLVKPFAARELLARVRMHLEMARLRREWASELERAYKELEAFSYSVSHDLRAPLRAIDGFANALLEEYGPKLDDRAGHYLGRVRTATKRMAQLIDDLLGLARIARTPLSRERVDVSALVRRVLRDLTELDPQRGVQTCILEGLVADGDPRLLAVLFENLLGNAWKFTARSCNPRIEVGQESRDDACVLFVRDNGAGFDMAYAGQLFAPFQRLHTESEFPGTGIGLATVQRVVSRHGGQIWAEAARDKGATFYFTLGAN